MVSRRVFCGAAGLVALAGNRPARGEAVSAVERVPMEWSFTSGKTYKDAFNEI